MALLPWLDFFFGWLRHAVLFRLLCFRPLVRFGPLVFFIGLAVGFVLLAVGCFWLLGHLDAFRFAGSWLGLPCLVRFQVSLMSFCWQPTKCSLLDCLLDSLWVCISSLAVIATIF